jgi:anti-anti-sigma regulatory factor
MSGSRRIKGGTVIRLEGGASVRQIGEIRDRVIHAIDVTDEPIIDLEGVSRADLAFVQLLFAAKRAVDARGGTLTVTGDHGLIQEAAGGSPDVQALLA